jgi:cyclase
MLKKRIILLLTFNNGVLFRTKKFIPDYRYTKNFIDILSCDEIILVDISKNKKNNKEFIKTVKYFSENCVVPLTVGGGIMNEQQADTFFKYGADKIILNSSSLVDLDLISLLSNKYGSQSIVHSVDCKKVANKYKVFVNNGTIDTNFGPVEWSKRVLDYGVGELIINNIDKDGSLMGFDINLIKTVNDTVKKPCVAVGGAGNWQHFLDLFKATDISGCCTQNIYHFTEESIVSLKSFLKKNKIEIRS